MYFPESQEVHAFLPDRPFSMYMNRKEVYAKIISCFKWIRTASNYKPTLRAVFFYKNINKRRSKHQNR